ncbi:hypothetical protein [Clostridium puniceum]|uniref:hypothetical protein n=1 Tax=Clostridium puniceum TaxID=29367 RepID=UPI001300D745|nr:hypothetical protein [Clostridium puniceum]
MITIFQDNIQIYNDIKEQIIRGDLNDSNKLSSIREYFTIYEITALTNQKAM